MVNTKMATQTLNIAQVQVVRKAALAGIVILGIAVLLAGESRWPGGTFLHECVEWIGFVLLVTAILGRTWCSLYIGGRKVSKLVDMGPYSATRNPLYVFSVIGAVGAGAQMGSVVIALVAGVVVYAIFRLVIAREEVTLSEALGQPYLDYMARVPRFLPRFTLWQDVEWLEIRPRNAAITFFDGLFFMMAIPLAEGIEWLHALGVLPKLFNLP